MPYVEKQYDSRPGCLNEKQFSIVTFCVKSKTVDKLSSSPLIESIFFCAGVLKCWCVDVEVLYGNPCGSKFSISSHAVITGWHQL